MLNRAAGSGISLRAARLAGSPSSVPRRRFRVRELGQRSGQSVVFSNEVWRRLARSLRLSKRESQIVSALFDDKKESAIATHLGISRHTVHTYTERLYRKMGVSSRVGLVRRIFVEYMSLARPLG